MFIASHRSIWVFVTCLAFLILNTVPVSAGAPAPRPETEGEHLPEHQVANLGDFQFDDGQVVPDFKISYVTHGTLNESKDNAILFIHIFAADHHAMDLFIGPGKGIDPNKYFIIAPDGLGNSKLGQELTTGPTNSGLEMKFPRYSYRDAIRAEYRLVKEYLGLDQLLAVVGYSVGAMKAYQFAVTYPDYARAIIPISGTPKTNPQMVWVLTSWMDVIALDPGWHGGNYENNPATGLKVMFDTFTAFSTNYSWMATAIKTPSDYQRIQRQSRDFWLPQDARDVYYQLSAWVTHDVGKSPGFDGDVTKALSSIKAEMLIIGAKEDFMFNRAESLAAKKAIPNATYLEIDSPAGHAHAYYDPQAYAKIAQEMEKFLAELQ